MQANIQACVKRVQDGDREAFTEIVREYQSRLRMYLGALLWDASRVDDLAQESFIAAYTRIDTYAAAAGEFYPWLKGIAWNVASNANRQWARQEKLKKDSAEDLRAAMAPHDGGEEEAFLDGAIERVRHCVERLPEDVRGVVKDFYFGRTTLAQMAARRGSSVGAMKMKLLRARQALKKCMETSGERL